MYTINSAAFSRFSAAGSSPKITLACDISFPNNVIPPTILYVKSDIISNLASAARAIDNGNYYISLTRTNITNQTSPTIEGYYLIYNPYDNTNNIGYSVDSSGTATAVAFDIIKKYAPWPIVAPSV